MEFEDAIKLKPGDIVKYNDIDTFIHPPSCTQYLFKIKTINVSHNLIGGNSALILADTEFQKFVRYHTQGQGSWTEWKPMVRHRMPCKLDSLHKVDETSYSALCLGLDIDI